MRFSGRIAGLGTTSGTRVVVGRWDESPFGAFTDVMTEDPTGHRTLLAPSRDVADLVAGTYTFDEVRVVPVQVVDTVDPDGEGVTWHVVADALEVLLTPGPRTTLGRALRLVPRQLATAPAWTLVTDPVARVVLRGVRTRGSAGGGRREFYGATDERSIAAATVSVGGALLGALAPVTPPPRFGFSSTPPRPSVTSVVTTIDGAAA